MASSPGHTLSTAARESSDPPASPEDDTEELVELSCIQGWVFSLPRCDALQQSHWPGLTGSPRWKVAAGAECHGTSMA